MEKYEHILESYSIIWKQKSKLVLEVNATRMNALNPKIYNEYIQNDYQKVLELSSREPVISISEYKPRRIITNFKKIKALYLIKMKFFEEEGLREGINGVSIPIFLLPMATDNIERIYHWRYQYTNHSNIEFSSGDLEIPAYKKMAELNSQLTIEGRQCCKEIEIATGIPTYYFLFRYIGWKDQLKESNRPCPSCGQPWQNKRKSENGINQFDFKCKKCRLISFAAIAFDNDRLAKIGYTANLKRKK